MKTIQRLSLCALFALCSLYANAYFGVVNSDGICIYYIIVSSDEYKYACQVTSCHNSRGYYTGTIRIPETAIDGSTARIYTVIGISDGVLSGDYIKDIELPKTISYIKGGRIGGANTSSITVDEENPYFCDVDGVMFSKDMKTLVQFPCSSPLLPSYDIPDGVTEIRDYAFYCAGLTGELKIPDSVTSIGNYAFYGCSGLTSLDIPNAVTSIGNYAFYKCTGLTGELIIPNSVTTIGKYAFYNCTGLTGELIIPNSVTTIMDYTFSDCKGLTSVVIPNSVTTIEIAAFGRCSNLESIYSLNPEPPECPYGSIFTDVDKEACTLYVPIGSYRSYATANQWKDFLNIVEMDMTGIESVSADDAEVSGYYTIDGKAVDAPQRGVNIIRYSDGSTKKVMMK